MRSLIVLIPAVLLSACATRLPPPQPVAETTAPVVCAYDDELLLPFVQSWLEARQRLAEPATTPRTGERP